PAKDGLYDEHIGLVQEGVAWFSDPGQGGPPDGQLEGLFQVQTHDSGQGVDPIDGNGNGNGNESGGGSVKSDSRGSKGGGREGAGASLVLITALALIGARRRRSGRAQRTSQCR